MTTTAGVLHHQHVPNPRDHEDPAAEQPDPTPAADAQHGQPEVLADLEIGRAELAARTRAAILERSNRQIVPLRKSFVQTPRALASDPSALAGPLAWFVSTRNARALTSYLMVVAATSSAHDEQGWSTTHPVRVWARAFGTTLTAEESAASNAVSKTLAKLEERRLITRERRGRERQVRLGLLREDGSGEPYTRPDGKALPDRFLRLSHDFWLAGWSETLSLPGIAMLLVALSEKPGFSLPTEKSPAWYGWSADTAERGLAELHDHGLLHKAARRRLEPLSPSGYGIRNHYYLLPPFGTFAPDILVPGPDATGGTQEQTSPTAHPTGTPSTPAEDHQ